MNELERTARNLMQDGNTYRDVARIMGIKISDVHTLVLSKKERIELLSKSDGRCQKCNKQLGNSLRVHHVKYGENPVIMLLCNSCHMKEHKGENRKVSADKTLGRPKEAVYIRDGRVYVALDMVSSVIAGDNATMLRHYHKLGKWFVDGIGFDTYAAAAAEFVRRVNG